MPDTSEFERKSYYELLGVEPSATLAEIKEAYREIARVYHPDSNFFDDIIDSDLSDSDNKIFQLVTAAYNTLVKEPERKAYDQKLKRSSFDSEPQKSSERSTNGAQPLKTQPRNKFGVVNEQPDSPGGTPYCRFGQQAKFQADAAAEEEVLAKRARIKRITLALFGVTVILVAVSVGLSVLVFN